jgi:deazaflavin-dependent oxidoreductase (nitroreductase family)
MTISDPVLEERVRQAFKGLNRFMLLFWRLGLGFWFRWPKVFGCIMVITHRGRKTGMLYRTPVNFTIQDGYIYCTAAFGSKADWYWNIVKNPEVEVWLPEGWWSGVAEEAKQAENRPEILRQILIASGFAAPAFGLHPEEISDEGLEALLENYHLIRIRRVAARTGPGGPGDLAWIWQVLSFLLLPIVLFQLKGKKTKNSNPN